MKDTGNAHSEDAWAPLGIGINTGIAHMGVIGNGKANDITPLGDEVNTTARLCSQAKAGEIYISEKTIEALKMHGNYEDLLSQLSIQKDEIKVKGKSEQLAVRIARVN